MLSKFAFFPKVYPDESLYSIVARYHKYSIGKTLKGTIEDIYGTRTISVSAEFPSHLEYLANSLNDDHLTKEIILYEHTLYPYYEPFIFTKEQKDIKQKMFYDGGGAIKGEIGFLAGSLVKKECLYVCTECIKEDILKYGESYFRVAWQAQGYLVCHKHNEVLIPYPVRQADVGRITFIPLEHDLVNMSQSHINQNNGLLKISKMINNILVGALRGFDADLLKNIYLKRLSELDLLTVSKEASYRKLLPLFNAHHSELLNLLDSEIDPSFESSWFRKIIRTKVVKVHPIRHLLYIDYLFDDLNELCKFTKKKNRKKKYPCLNKICPKFKIDLIENVVVTADSKSREKVGTFKCPVCGYVYSRKLNSTNKYEKGRVKEFGTLFREELNRLNDISDMSLRGKARYLGCDPNTVKKYNHLL